MDFNNPKVYGDTFISDGLVHEIMQLIVICSLPLEWFVAHNALRAMGSNRMRRFLIFLKELMQGAHYYAALPRIFIYLISFAEKCITWVLICQTSCSSIGKKCGK